MALGAKILYPATTTSYAESAGFAAHDASYLIINEAEAAGHVILRIRACSYDNFGEASETPSVTYPITQLQLSNSPNFDADRTLTLPYLERWHYGLENMTGYDPLTIPSGDKYALPPTEDDYANQVMQITGWRLDAGEGPKTIYVRFITAGGILPNPSGVYKGFRDDLIAIQTSPSLPKTARVENETDNHYVPANTTFTWQESQDNISGLRGYEIDLLVDGDDIFTESCSDTSDFDMNRQAAEEAVANDLPSLRTRFSSALLPSNLTFETVTGQSKVRATFMNTSATPMGHEVQFENVIDRQDDNELSNFEIHLRGRPEFPDDPSSDGTFYAAVQTFDGLYSNARSVRALPAGLRVGIPSKFRRDMLDAWANIDIAWLYSGTVMGGGTQVLRRQRAQAITAFDLQAGRVSVYGIRTLNITGSETPTLRSDGAYWNAYSINVSNTKSVPDQMYGTMTYYAETIKSPDQVSGYTVIGIGVQGLGGQFRNYSQTATTNYGNAIRIVAFYDNIYGSLGLTENQLAQCHIRATLGYVSPTGFSTTLATSGVNVTCETTYAGLQVAPINPQGLISSNNVTYSHLETTSPSRSWNPAMSSYLTFVFENIPTYSNANGILLEIWSDPGLGHDPPKLRIPYVIAYSGSSGSYYNPTSPTQAYYSSVIYNLIKNPIYNPDGSIAGYDQGNFSNGVTDSPNRIPGGGGGGIYLHPLFELYNYRTTTKSVNALESRLTVKDTNTPSRNLHSMEATVSVTPPSIYSTRDNMEAAADVTRDSGPGRRSLPLDIVVNHDITRHSIRSVDAELEVIESLNSVTDLPVTLDVTRIYSNINTLPVSAEVTGGTSAVQPLQASIFVTAAWNRDAIYTDIANTHNVINAMGDPWADYILVEFNKDGSYAMVRPTHDVNGLLTGYTRTVLSTTATEHNFGDSNTDLEVAYRENRYDVEETSHPSFDIGADLSINDATKVWYDPFTILWQRFTPTAEMFYIDRLKIRVENADSGSDLFHVQAIICPADESGLPTITDSPTIPDRRTDAFGANGALIFKSAVWPDGDSYPTCDLNKHRVWSEVVQIPAGTSDVVLTGEGFSTTSLSGVGLTPGRTYFLGVTIMRVQHNTPDPNLTFTSTTMDENFRYHSYGPRIRWKTLNMPIDSNLPERMVSVRANIPSPSVDWINEYKSTEQPTNPALFQTYDNADEITVTYSTFPEIMQDDAELLVTYSDITGSSVNRLSETHSITPLQPLPRRAALVGMRGSSMGVTDEASLTYDHLRSSDRSIISNIDLSDGIGYSVETPVEQTENIYVIGEQTSWAPDDWGTTWSARYGATPGISISTSDGDLTFISPVGDPDSILRSAEAHYLKPSQGKSFSMETRMSLTAQTLDTEFYVMILPSLYAANISEVQMVSDETPSDFMILGFRYNGDVYLYRPDPNSGIVVGELIHTWGSMSPYDWGGGDLKVRITNSIPGRTALSLWHGVALLYTSDSQREYTPESDLGFWLGLGFRSQRNLTGQTRFDVGNVQIYKVSRDDPSIMIGSLLHSEHFSSVPIRWFVWPGVEELYPGGSSILCGIVNQNTAESYQTAHRIMAPTNVYSQAMYAAGTPDADTLDENGYPDPYRVRLAVSIDDVSSVSQLSTYRRWIGPSLISRYPISNVALTDAIRIDFNYELSYADIDGNSEILFGIANWLPTNGYPTSTGAIAAEDYAAFSFMETDDAILGTRYNTRARVNAINASSTPMLIGLEEEQYQTKSPTFALIAYSSDDKAKLIWGKQPNGSANSPVPITSFISDSFIPQRGVLSLIIKPVSTGQDLLPESDQVNVSLRITKGGTPVNEITEGDQITVSWTSVNAVGVTSNTNFGATQVNGSLADSPTASRYYNIEVVDALGVRASASQYITVNAAFSTELSGDLTIAPNPAVSGNSIMATWSFSNAAAITDTNVPGVAPGTDLPSGGSKVFTAPSTNTPYYITVRDTSGQQTYTARTTLNITAAPPTTTPSITLSASQSTVPLGGQVTLTWAAQNSTYVTLSQSGGGYWTLGTSGSQSFTMTGTSAFVITAFDSTGQNASASVNVAVDTTPTLSVTVSPSTEITLGQTLTFHFVTTNATYIHSNQVGGMPAIVTDGQTFTPSSTGSFLFQFRANNSPSDQSSGAYYQIGVTVTQTVAAPTIISFVANPTTATGGQTITLTYSVSASTTSLSIDRGVGNVPLHAGSVTTPFPVGASPVTYTLTATNEGGTVASSATVAANISGSYTEYPDLQQVNTEANNVLSPGYTQVTSITASPYPTATFAYLLNSGGYYVYREWLVGLNVLPDPHSDVIKADLVFKFTAPASGYVKRLTANPATGQALRTAGTDVYFTTEQTVDSNGYYVARVDCREMVGYWMGFGGNLGVLIDPALNQAANAGMRTSDDPVLAARPAWDMAYATVTVPSNLSTPSSQTTVNTEANNLLSPGYTQVTSITTSPYPTATFAYLLNSGGYYVYRPHLSGPTSVPPTGADVQTATIKLTFTAPASGYVKRLTANPATGQALRTAGTDVYFTTGGTANSDGKYVATIDLREMVGYWMAFANSNFGILIDPASNQAANAGMRTISDPTYAYRPQWDIQYTTVGSQSVRMASVTSSSVSAMATDPLYCDLEVRMNDVHYCQVSGVPFNFNSTDGTRFVWGTRRKSPGSAFGTSAVVNRFKLSCIDIRTVPTGDEAVNLVVWEKTNGNLPSNTLFYGRNTDAFQEKDDTAVFTTRTVFAQRFFAGRTRLRAASLRINNSTGSGVVNAIVCACDTTGTPLIGVGSDGHVDLTNRTNILGMAYGRYVPGTKEIFFVFHPGITLTANRQYAILFDEPTGASNFFIYGTKETGLIPRCSTLAWDKGNGVWGDTNSLACFRTYGDLYVNRENQHHGRRLLGRVRSTSNAGMPDYSTIYAPGYGLNQQRLASEFSLPTDTVQADLLGPFAPGDPSQPPSLRVDGDPDVSANNDGFIVRLKVGAQDALPPAVVGSGVKDFRIIYETDFGEMQPTAFKTWNDTDDDGYVVFDLYYGGRFLDTRRFYAEVRDLVGNVSKSDDLYVNFIYAYIQDTIAPSLVRVRIEGDAFIDPDPDEALATRLEDVNVSLLVVDEQTGCKDFRVNRNFAETSAGALLYENYRPYLFQFRDTLTGTDGVYALGVQARDYGNNATQAIWQHIERINYENRTTVKEIPTALCSYAITAGAAPVLMIGTTRRTARTNLEGRNTSVIGYIAYTVYEPWIGNARQTIKANEEVTVRVNGITTTLYTIDRDNDWIVFDEPIVPEDVVSIDIVEEIAVLYRYDRTSKRAVKVFDSENERAISCLMAYDGLLYIGMASGRIYAYNGIRTSLSLFRTTDGLGVPIPVSCMSVAQFESDDIPFLYVGTYDSPQVFRYGGNPADTLLGWTRLTTLCSAMITETDVHAIEMYEDIIWVATGPFGRIYGYSRTIDNDGNLAESVSSTQVYADEFTADPSFRMNVLCLRAWDERIYAGVDHKSSVFVYQLVRTDQPATGEWDAQDEFDNNFQDSPLPWEFYNEGNIDYRSSDRISFTEVIDDTTGEISDYYMTLDGRAGEYCCWIDRSSTTGSLWQQINNTTGWTMQFDLRLQTFGNPASACNQGAIAYDGTYMVEFKLTSTAITIVSGEATESVPLSIDTREWHTYRLAVHGRNVEVYLDGDDVPILQAIDFLEFETTGRAIMFGKNHDSSGSCKANWRRLWYYLGGAVSPQTTVERDWTRAQVIPFGSQVRFLEILPSGLVVGVQPRNPADFSIHDDLSTLVARTYLRPAGKSDIWSYDTIYGTRGSSLVAATVYDAHLWTSVEVSDTLLTNTPLSRPAFVKESPATPMLKNGNIYERRLSQSFDTIIKDTMAPDAGVIINENTAAGSVQVFAMESYVGTDKRTGGFIATYSPLGSEVGSANQVVDGDPDTYIAIGTNEVRYVAHDFGGDGNTTLDLAKIVWGCRSAIRKTYLVQYLSPDDGQWKTIVRMMSDAAGDSNFFQYVFTPALKANGLRIYYAGDRTTVENDIELTLSSFDMGIGTAGYQLSRRPDMSDATAWTTMTDDTIKLNWALTESNQVWETTNTSSRPYTTGIIYGGYMILASTDGYVHVSSDGTSFNTSTFTAGCHINAFAEYRDTLFLGTDDGKIYESENGIDWTFVYDTGQDRILSLASYNDKLYIGTGDNGKLYTYDGETLLNVKTFAVTGISALHTHGSGSSSLLHIGLAPTGQIFKYDGSSYTQTADLPVAQVNAFADYTDVPFAACSNGRLYHYAAQTGGGSAWTLLLDSDRRNISGLTSYDKVGPTITSVSPEGVGILKSGTYRYIITYVDYAGVESTAGESYEYDNLSDNGRLKVQWQTISSARGYRIYRTVEPNQGAGLERLMYVGELTDPSFYDDGTDIVLGGQTYTGSDGKEAKREDISPPKTAASTLWFTGDSTYAYTYDGSALIQIALPDGATGANGVLSFRSHLYIFGQARPYTDAELTGDIDLLSINGKVIRWIATSVGSGEKAVYARFIDGIGNETGVLTATIFYDALLENRIVEVDPTGTIVTNHESQSDPRQKLYAPHKSLEQIGIYESQPFYASNLSRWTVAELMAQLPYDTEVRLYVRSAQSRDECLAAEWTGPYSLENTTPDLYYYDNTTYEYSNIDYDWHYVDRGYYYYGGGVIESLAADISTLEGPWLQFRLELVTSEKNFSPTVFYVILRYQSTNAAMFYSAVFNLDDIAQRERQQEGGIKARRGILTWNGTIPEGGDVRFGISTKVPETGDWSEYQEVTPNRTFEITDPGNVKVGIMLISTDTGTAIVDEWGMMLDMGDRDVRINIDESTER